MGQINFNGVDRKINVIKIKPINNYGIKINYAKGNEDEEQKLNNEIIDIENQIINTNENCSIFILFDIQLKYYTKSMNQNFYYLLILIKLIFLFKFSLS